MNQQKKWKAWSTALLLAGVLAFAGCQKGVVEGDEASDEHHVEGETNTKGNIEYVGGDSSSMTVDITGVITDDLGYPLEGASVYAAGSSATTGAGGIYTLEGLPITQVVNDIGTLEANIAATAAQDFADQNANLSTVPVSVAYDNHTPAVVYVGTHLVVTDSCESATNTGGAGTCTSNSPNTVIINGLAGDSGSVALKRLSANVRGYIENLTTGAPASGVQITFVPTDNNISNLTGTPGVAAPYTAGEVTWGHKASDLVASTDSDGRYDITGIAVDTMFDIYVTEEGFTGGGAANFANGRTLTREPSANDDLGDNVSQCGGNGASTANSPSSCLGSVNTAGGIVDMPVLFVKKSTLGSSGQDDIRPYIKSVAGTSLASTSTSIHSGNGYLQLTEGVFTTAETDTTTFSPNPLEITFSETMDNSRFQPDASSSQAPISVVVFDTNGNEYAVDSSNTSLSGSTLTLAMSTASMPVSKGTALLVRLRTYDFIDTGNQELTVSNTINTTITNANTLGYNVAVPTGWVTLRLRTFKETSTTATSVTLTQSDYTAFSTGSTTLYQYEGLSTYLAPMELRNASGLGETADVKKNGTVGIVGQLNAGSATRLETLAESLGIAATVDTTIVELGFTATKSSNYHLTVTDTSSDLVSTSDYTLVAGKTYTSSTLATTADGISVSGSVSKGWQITATDETQKIWLRSMVSGYTVALYPENDFGDAVVAQGSTVVLTDKIAPMVTVQQSLTSDGEDTTTAQGAPQDTITTDTTGTDNTTSAGDNDGGGIVTTDTTVFEYPNFFMEARFYVNSNRENSSTYASRPLLGNQSSSSYSTYSSSRTDEYYTAADYAQWNSNVGSTRTFVYNMSEALDTSTTTLATLQESSSNSAESLFDATNGITEVGYQLNGSVPQLTTKIVDWRTIADKAFLDITNVKDSSGNTAGTTTGVIFRDKTPPLVIALTTNGAILSIAFDQKIDDLTSSNYTTSPATSVLSISTSGVVHSAGMDPTFGFAGSNFNYHVSVTNEGDTVVERDQQFFDFAENTIAAGTKLLATKELASDSKSLTITVSNTTVSVGSGTDSKSAGSAQMGSYFSPLHYEQASAVGNPDIYAFYGNLRDENGVTWGSTVAGSGNYYVFNSAGRGIEPHIMVADATPPKIASTSWIGGKADNKIDLGSSGTDAALAISHTGITQGSAASPLTYYIINGTSGVGNVTETDSIWTIGDSNNANEVESYKVLVGFTEAIVCNSCTLTASSSTKYTTSTPTPVNSRHNTSTTLLGSSSNTLLLTFQLNANQTAVANDSMTVAGVEDTSGNTMSTFTISLATTAGSGILVTPTSAVY